MLERPVLHRIDLQIVDKGAAIHGHLVLIHWFSVASQLWLHLILPAGLRGCRLALDGALRVVPKRVECQGVAVFVDASARRDLLLAQLPVLTLPLTAAVP